jgi:hypothetical protein
MITIGHAISSLYPNAQCAIDNDSYDGIRWFDNSIPMPTKEEVQAEVSRLQAEYDAKEYQRKRAREYPSYADQFDLLYHGGYDAWKAEIDKVKEKYPKP